MAKDVDVRRITRQCLQRLAQSITVNNAILTGSWATGAYLEDSDVDLIIVPDDFRTMPISERQKDSSLDLVRARAVYASSEIVRVLRAFFLVVLECHAFYV